jgi:hypothetical protein
LHLGLKPIERQNLLIFTRSKIVQRKKLVGIGWLMMDISTMVRGGSCFLSLLKIAGGCHAIAANGSGIAEGRDLEAESFSLAQMSNRSTNG